MEKLDFIIWFLTQDRNAPILFIGMVLSALATLVSFASGNIILGWILVVIIATFFLTLVVYSLLKILKKQYIEFQKQTQRTKP